MTFNYQKTEKFIGHVRALIEQGSLCSRREKEISKAKHGLGKISRGEKRAILQRCLLAFYAFGQKFMLFNGLRKITSDTSLIASQMQIPNRNCERTMTSMNN